MSQELELCGTCGRTLASNAYACPHCGAPTARAAGTLRVLLAVLAVCLVVGVADVLAIALSG